MQNTKSMYFVNNNKSKNTKISINSPLFTRSVLSRANANSVSVNVASDALSDDDGVSLRPAVGLYANDK